MYARKKQEQDQLDELGKQRKGKGCKCHTVQLGGRMGQVTATDVANTLGNTRLDAQVGGDDKPLDDDLRRRAARMRALDACSSAETEEPSTAEAVPQGSAELVEVSDARTCDDVSVMDESSSSMCRSSKGLLQGRMTLRRVSTRRREPTSSVA
jgi:hypothetical protein